MERHGQVMIVELVMVGTEILMGNIVNTNAAYLAEQCAGLGLNCYYQDVVGDNKERMLETIRRAYERSEIVILSGGLGPTEDDLTKETAAEVMGRKLHEDEIVKQDIKAYFEKTGRNIAENNWKQASVPDGSIVIKNENGTAPGIIMTEGKKAMILLPGPPNELIPMFEYSIKPALARLSGETLYSKTVKIAGVPESDAEMRVKDLLKNQTNPTIAPYAKTGEVHFRITAKARTEEEAKILIKPIIHQFRERFLMDVYTTKTDETLEMALVKLLKKHHMTLSVAESCTGGLVAGRIINVAGVSDILKAGFVTYAEEAKRKVLGVKKKTLEKYTAVSKQTAEEMALGALKAGNTDVAIATTGIAGPDGGTEKQPVGLVYIACAIGEKVVVKECHFNGNRAKVREAAVAEAINLIRTSVLRYIE